MLTRYQKGTGAHWERFVQIMSPLSIKVRLIDCENNRRCRSLGAVFPRQCYNAVITLLSKYIYEITIVIIINKQTINHSDFGDCVNFFLSTFKEFSKLLGMSV